MLLYHYSNESHKQLYTIRHQNIMSDEEIEAEEQKAEYRYAIGSYIDHISFFVEPAPLHVLGQLYKGHPEAVWTPGRVMYEHVVETKDIGRFKYGVVATETDLKELDEFLIKYPPEKDTPKEILREYFHKESIRKWKTKEYGYDNRDFESAAKPYVGKTLQGFYDAIPLFSKNNWKHYAAFVPHVMIYPESGMCKLHGIAKRVVVGNISTESFNNTQLYIPPSAKW